MPRTVPMKPMAGIAHAMYRIIDSFMARRQLLGIKERAERYGTRDLDPELPETGARDQFQLYHVIYASGEEAGVPGKENARQAREWAVAAGVISGEN